ncbi:MAG: hypothetical protein MZV64_02135 [Ignavibacteriales bacterium]|nr:hypothetical protein [Ignavibacteriales bacterium]
MTQAQAEEIVYSDEFYSVQGALELFVQFGTIKFLLYNTRMFDRFFQQLLLLHPPINLCDGVL